MVRWKKVMRNTAIASGVTGVIIAGTLGYLSHRILENHRAFVRAHHQEIYNAMKLNITNNLGIELSDIPIRIRDLPRRESAAYFPEKHEIVLDELAGFGRYMHEPSLPLRRILGIGSDIAHEIGHAYVWQRREELDSIMSYVTIPLVEEGIANYVANAATGDRQTCQAWPLTERQAERAMYVGVFSGHAVDEAYDCGALFVTPVLKCLGFESGVDTLISFPPTLDEVIAPGTYYGRILPDECPEK